MKRESWQGVVEFVTVVDEGSLTAAAHALGVSVSRVSRHMDALEDRLGVTLLQRTTRKLHLTEAGKAYHQTCKQLLLDLEEMNHDLREGTHQPRGKIRITSGGVYVAQEIAPVLAEFMMVYPEISIELDLTPRKVDLIEEGYDLAIRFGVLEDSSLKARKLTPRKLVVCGSPEYLQRRGQPTHPDDLIHHDCLPGNAETWRFQDKNVIRHIRVHGRFRCGHPTALAAAAEKSLGLIYVPQFYVRDQLASGTLVPVLEAYVATDKATWLIYPAQGYQTARVRLLIDFLFNHLEEISEEEQP